MQCAIVRYPSLMHGEPPVSADSECDVNLALSPVSRSTGSMKVNRPSRTGGTDGYAERARRGRSLLPVALRGLARGRRLRRPLRLGRHRALASITEEGLPDAVVLDVNMPHLDGLELCRILRRAEPALPIVIVSAHDDLADLGRLAGASAVLAKPSTPAELCGVLRRLLA